MLFVWIAVFIISLAFLVKSAGFFTEASEKIGLAMGMSPFVIGVTIVAIGTSLPELASSFAAVLKGDTTIVVANAVGSNVANICLIVGLSAIAAKDLIVKRSLIDLDLPLLASVTAIALYMFSDAKVTRIEGVILILSFIIYMIYTASTRTKKKGKKIGVDDLPLIDKNEIKQDTIEIKKDGKKEKIPTLSLNIFIVIVASAAVLVLSASVTIESVIHIATILAIPSSVVAISAVAIGTSLPELAVSLEAARKKKHEIALGNIMGSNIFNLLLVVGLPAIFTTLVIDETTMKVGLAFLFGSTILFIFSGISKHIHKWEGLLFVVIYIIFIGQLFNIL